MARPPERLPLGTALLLLTLLAAPGPALPAQAQDAAKPAGAAETAPEPKPTVIPMGEVATRADRLEGRLREMRSGLGTADLEEQVEAWLAAAKQQRADLEERIAAGAADRTLFPSQLAVLSTSWETLDSQLGDQATGIGERTGELDADVAEIRETRALWERTLAEARTAAAPEAVQRRVRQIIAELRSTQGEIEKTRDAALELQARLVEQQRALEPIRGRIDALEEEVVASVFVRQGEPLWRSWPGLAVSGESLARVPERIAENGRELRDYARGHGGRLALQALLFLGLAWLFSRARSSLVRRAAEDASRDPAEEGASPADALRHPWAAALLVALVLTRFVHPERAAALSYLSIFLVAPVWLPVLRGMLPAALEGFLVGTAALSLLEVFRFAVGWPGFRNQALLTVNLAAGLAGVLWLLRPERLRRVPARLGQGFWFRLLGGWLRAAGVALAVGIGAALLGYVELASRIALVAILGTFFGGGWLAMVRLAEASAEAAVDAGRLDRLHMIRANRALTLRFFRVGLRASAALVFGYIVLAAVQLWDPVLGGAEAVLSAQVGFGPVSFSLGGVLAFGLTLWLSWLLARFVAFTLDQEVFTRVRMPSGVPFALATFTRYGILVIGFVIAMAMLGFSLDRLTLLLSALGVGIGFGLQNVVNNFVSGIILLFERPVRVGDRVQLDDLLGTVEKIGIRASRVRTFDGSDVIVPNGEFISTRLTNWTLSDEKRRITLPVGVAYGTKPRPVLELLEGVAHAHPEVLKDPAPEALFRAFGTSSLDFELRAFTESPRGYLSVMSDLAVATEEALENAGITIPFPQRDLHLKNVADVREALSETLRQAPQPGAERRPDGEGADAG